MAAMAPLSRRHTLSRAAVVLVLFEHGQRWVWARPARGQPAPVIPWTGCSLDEHPPSGLLEPPIPLGSDRRHVQVASHSSAGAPPGSTTSSS